MTTDEINKAFEELIDRRGIHHQVGETSGHIRQLRAKLKNGISISTDLKLRLLQKSGWKQDGKEYDDQDLVSLLNFYKKTSQAARDHGPEYVIEKWKISKKLQ